jgi:hypothetical protein
MYTRRLVPLLVAIGLGIGVAACGGSSLTAAQVQTKCVHTGPQTYFDLAINPTVCRCEVRQGVREHHSLAQIDDEFVGDKETAPAIDAYGRCLSQLFSHARTTFITRGQYKALLRHRRLRSVLSSG